MADSLPNTSRSLLAADGGLSDPKCRRRKEASERNSTSGENETAVGERKPVGGRPLARPLGGSAALARCLPDALVNISP